MGAAERPLRCLSWNLALLERSDQAPLRWSVDQTEAEIRRIVMALDPDVVHFQELPGSVPYIETYGMVPGNPRTHSGYLATLVRHELMVPAPAVTAIEGSALLTTIGSLTVANVHLEPGRGGRAERLRQLGAIVAASPTEALVVLGDTNTRVGELDDVADTLGLVADPLPGPTWDTRRNRFRPQPRGSTGVVAYFTRTFRSAQASLTEVLVPDAAVEADDHRFHLSDHYPLLVTAVPAGPSSGQT